MRRGDIYFVAFDPAEGSEAAKTRPAVIVSNDGANRSSERTGRGTVTVVPITSNVERVLSFQLLLEAGEGGLKHASKTQPEQIRVVSPSRFGHYVGTLGLERMRQLDDGLRVHLSL
jgi:mRNA interferase MazF